MTACSSFVSVSSDRGLLSGRSISVTHIFRSQFPDPLNNFHESSVNNLQSQVLGDQSGYSRLSSLTCELNYWVAPNVDVIEVENDVTVRNEA